MSIIKEGKNIIGVYKGDIPILKIFKHNNLVYQHSSTGGTETQYDIISTFNVTSTTSPTQLCYSSATSAFTEMYVDDVKIDVTSAYTFNTTGEHTVNYILSDKTAIVRNAFQNCSGLTSVTIPDSVKSIGIWAFGRCTSLTSITIPNSVTIIGNYDFLDCTSLTSVYIGSGVTSIGNYSFYNCTSLNSITCYATTAPSLGTSVFYKFESNGKLYVPQGSDYSTWTAILRSWKIQYLT